MPDRKTQNLNILSVLSNREHLQDWTIFEDGKPVRRIYEDVSERVVGQPLTGARDLRDSGAYCDYGQISCKDRV